MNNNLLQTKLFGLLSDASQQATDGELQTAYEEFTRQATTLSQSKMNYSIVFRSLSLVRIELSGLSILYEGGKKHA